MVVAVSVEEDESCSGDLSKTRYAKDAVKTEAMAIMISTNAMNVLLMSLTL